MSDVEDERGQENGKEPQHGDEHRDDGSDDDVKINKSLKEGKDTRADVKEEREGREGREERGHGSRERDRKRSHKDKDRRRSRSREHRRSRSRSRGDRRRGSRRSRSRSRSRGDRRSSRRHRSSSREHRRRRSRSRSRSRDGGYQPRKKMDVSLPAVAMGPGTGNDPFAALRQQSQISTVDPADIQRMWQEQQLKARQLVLSQQAVSAAQAASKTQREIYVGNLMPGAITDTMLMQIFNTALMVRFPGSNMPGMEPVVKVNPHSSGKYAFVEFRTPEMATAALDLNGQVQFMGQAMSVNRPSGYVDPGRAAVAAAAASQALTAFQRGDLSALQAANAAGAGLAGITAAPLTGPLGAVGALQSAAVAQTMAAAMLPGGGAAVALPGAAPAAAAAAPAAASGALSATPTQFVCVVGMVTAEMLADEMEYAEVVADLRDECNRHAPNSVVHVKVPRPPQPHLSAQLFGTGNYGKAFVQFSDVASAQAAKAAIHGRIFAGSAVHALFVTAEGFAMA